ncbi:MAG: DUF3857 domain-containing protein [Candidatus Omnitrophota bacterium]
MFLKSSPKLIIYLLTVLLLGCSQPKAVPVEPGSLEKLTVQYQDLIQEHEQLLENNPADLALRLKLARFYYDFKDYRKVSQLLTGQESPEAKILLAKAFSRLKDYDYAIAVFEQLKPFPEDPESLYLYAEVLEKKNLFPKALETYAQVKGALSAQARERIIAIRAEEVGDQVPQEISQLLQDSEDFLSQSQDDAAAYLLVDEQSEIFPDNTSVSIVHVIEKVLKERGKELAEVDIGYDSTYQRVELEFARTITKEGKVRYTAGENIRDVSRYLNFPLYSNSRAFIISMPSVDVGALIEYKVKIYSSKLVNDEDFSFIYRLREEYPVCKARFKLAIPKKSEIFFKFLNREYAEGVKLQPSVSETGDKKTYTWEFQQIKPIIPEYAMPPQSYLNPAVLISSFSSWDEIYGWWQPLYQDKLALSQEMKEFLNQRIKGVTSDIEKAKKIYEFVAKNIRYVAIEYGQGGHEPHRVEEVFINRYGDCKDQAILLVSLLRQAGLKAYPVLIPTDRIYPIDKDFPSINFNHAICAVQINEDLIFMDPTAETTPFGEIPLGDQNRPVMVFFDDHWQIVLTDTSKDSRVSYQMEISIDQEENANIRRQVRSFGFFASSYRGYLKYTHPELIEEDIRQKMKEISSLSSLIDYNIENADDFDLNPVLTYNFRVEKFFNPAGNLRIVPALDQIQLDRKLISKDTRQFPIDFSGLYSKDAKIKINLPKNLKVKYLPKPFSLENPWFKLEVSYRNLNQAVDFYQNLNVRKRFVEVKDYDKFVGYLEEAIYLLREEVILEAR